MRSSMDEAHTPGPESIGQRLRRLRLERKLSQRELSSPGVSYAYISRIEAGARRPSVKALRQLARKLGVSVEYLETGSDLREVDERELRLADAELELRLADDPEKAQSVLQGILDDAVAAGDSTSALRARIAIGLAEARAGNNTAAAQRLEEAIGSDLLAPSQRPDVYATLGQCYAALGQPQRAVDLFESCLARVAEESPEDTTNQVRFSTYLSYALSDLGDLSRAEAVLADALAQADQVTDAYTRVRLYWSLARLNEIRKQPAAALDYIRRAIALLEVTEDTLHLARAHLLCGTIMMSQGKAEEAGAQFAAAERMFGPKPDPLDLANLRADQARRAALLDRPAETERLAREALTALGDGYPTERGVYLGILAEALAKQDNPEADETFKLAVQLIDEHGRQVEKADAFRAWARYLRKSGRESEALDVLDRAAELSSTPTRPQSLT
jgi:transcriptional regulator with XRE-family HTH domain